MKETVIKRINEVESVSLLYPEFMSPEAAENIKKLQENIWAVGDEIHSHRSAIYELEKCEDKIKIKSLNPIENDFIEDAVEVLKKFYKTNSSFF